MAKEIENLGRLHDYREHLLTISRGLEEMAKAAGRTEWTLNQLLRECYNLVGIEMKTMRQWNRAGRVVRKGQHAYLFWTKDRNSTSELTDESYLSFLFAEEQTAEKG